MTKKKKYLGTLLLLQVLYEWHPTHLIRELMHTNQDSVKKDWQGQNPSQPLGINRREEQHWGHEAI